MDKPVIKAPIIYLGPIGTELGFNLAGMETRSCASGPELMVQLKKIKEKSGSGIVLVDEKIASEVLDDVEVLQKEELLSIVLLPHPTESKGIAARVLDDLMIRAIGTDIFSNQ